MQTKICTCFFAIYLIFLYGCQNAIVDSGSGSGLNQKIIVSFSGLTANGSSGLVTTTSLTLSFDSDPGNLSINDITITGATKGLLSGAGTTRTLTISAITVANGANITLAISSPVGYTISPATKTVAVYVGAVMTAVTFRYMIANGSQGSASTTTLGLYFSSDPGNLTVNDIEVIGATKNVLIGTGDTRYLSISAITIAEGENITVKITSPSGYIINSATQQVAVHVVPALLSITANGISGAESTTTLTLSFDRDPGSSFTLNNLYLIGATLGNLSTTGANRTLEISGITVGNGGKVKLSISDIGPYFSRDIVVYTAPTFWFASSTMTVLTHGGCVKLQLVDKDQKPYSNNYIVFSSSIEQNKVVQVQLDGSCYFFPNYCALTNVVARNTLTGEETTCRISVGWALTVTGTVFYNTYPTKYSIGLVTVQTKVIKGTNGNIKGYAYRKISYEEMFVNTPPVSFTQMINTDDISWLNESYIYFYYSSSTPASDDVLSGLIPNISFTIEPLLFEDVNGNGAFDVKDIPQPGFPVNNGIFYAGVTTNQQIQWEDQKMDYMFYTGNLIDINGKEQKSLYFMDKELTKK